MLKILSTMIRKDIEKMVAEGSLRYHHSATERGYLSVKRDGEVIPYSGKFGSGYIVRTANMRTVRLSRRYYMIEYYIFV